MKIESKTIYNLKDEKTFNHFKECAKKQGVDLGSFLGTSQYHNIPHAGEDFWIRITTIPTTRDSIGYDRFSFYEERYKDHKIVVWVQNRKPEIIRLGNLKIVFKGDYTIVTDGRFTGKAKRNPADEYDAVVGLKLAVERYEKDKQEKDILVNFVAQYYLEQMLSKCIKPIRFVKSEEKEK